MQRHAHSLPGLIPLARRDAVNVALAAAFGAKPVNSLQLLRGGVSGAMIWRVDVNGRPFVMRLEPERIALRHRQRNYACMGAAAAAGIAPAVLHADAAEGVAIMEFVDARPLSEHPSGRAGLVRELGELVARLQGLSSFPPLGDSSDMLTALLDNLIASGLFSAGLLDPHKEALARIRAAYPWDTSSVVSSHNDPNPRNMVFDGRRVWLIDWELASCNDPLFDIAILTTELADTAELEDTLLASALGRRVDAALRDRLSVVRLLTDLFYGCIALEAFAPAPRSSSPETNVNGLTPSEFRGAVGQMSSASEVAWAFGKMSLRAFIDGGAASSFQAILAAAR